MNAMELLKQDHDAVKRLFSEFESAGDSTQDKRDLVEQIIEELEIHSAIEEEMFYPAVRNADSKEAESEIEEALNGHQQVKMLLQELSEMDAADEPAFSDKLKTLKQNVQQHVKVEEREIFSTAQQALGAEQLARLGEQLETRRKELRGKGVEIQRTFSSK